MFSRGNRLKVSISLINVLSSHQLYVNTQSKASLIMIPYIFNAWSHLWWNHIYIYIYRFIITYFSRTGKLPIFAITWFENSIKWYTRWLHLLILKIIRQVRSVEEILATSWQLEIGVCIEHARAELNESQDSVWANCKFWLQLIVQDSLWSKI